ncbi:MAG: HAD family hydrolase [Solobacterium sp.]|nr:HAD family hydrolase [Solobacterium sp.]
MKYSRLYDILSGYDLILFDMDGTLYFQRAMQMRMALKLLGHAVSSTKGIRDIRIISVFRKLREQWDSSTPMDDAVLYRQTAGKTGASAEETEQVIRKWMFEVPMHAVATSADKELALVIDKLLADGRHVCIYSDYETEGKCAALHIPDAVRQYYCGKGAITTMKPNPAGILEVLKQYPDIPADKAVMVGDRMDRDGEAAAQAGIAGIILGKFRLQRENAYK